VHGSGSGTKCGKSNSQTGHRAACARCDLALNRFVGAYDAGPDHQSQDRTQAIGGIIWGVGQALLEQSETDPGMGRFLNRNYSSYLVPTNADIPELDVLFVGEFDGEASPLGSKGPGELTAVSVAPAIAMPCITRPASVCATCQSPWKGCCEGEHVVVATLVVEWKRETLK
jgi:molybdopterin-binding aldehyde dehydrogenase-like protein